MDQSTNRSRVTIVNNLVLSSQEKTSDYGNLEEPEVIDITFDDIDDEAEENNPSTSGEPHDFKNLFFEVLNKQVYSTKRKLDWRVGQCEEKRLRVEQKVNENTESDDDDEDVVFNYMTGTYEPVKKSSESRHGKIITHSKNESEDISIEEIHFVNEETVAAKPGTLQRSSVNLALTKPNFPYTVGLLQTQVSQNTISPNIAEKIVVLDESSTPSHSSIPSTTTFVDCNSPPHDGNYPIQSITSPAASLSLPIKENSNDTIIIPKSNSDAENVSTSIVEKKTFKLKDLVVLLKRLPKSSLISSNSSNVDVGKEKKTNKNKHRSSVGASEFKPNNKQEQDFVKKLRGRLSLINCVCRTCGYRAATKNGLISHIYNAHLQEENQTKTKCKGITLPVITSVESIALTLENSNVPDCTARSPVKNIKGNDKSPPKTTVPKKKKKSEVTLDSKDKLPLETKTNRYHCGLCNFKTFKELNLKYHAGKHNGKKYFCDDHFWSGAEISCTKCIFENIMSNLSRSLLTCKKCGYSTARGHYFKLHASAPFSCSQYILREKNKKKRLECSSDPSEDQRDVELSEKSTLPVESQNKTTLSDAGDNICLGVVCSMNSDVLLDTSTQKNIKQVQNIESLDFNKENAIENMENSNEIVIKQPVKDNVVSLNGSDSKETENYLNKQLSVQNPDKNNEQPKKHTCIEDPSQGVEDGNSSTIPNTGVIETDSPSKENNIQSSANSAYNVSSLNTCSIILKDSFSKGLNIENSDENNKQPKEDTCTENSSSSLESREDPSQAAKVVISLIADKDQEGTVSESIETGFPCKENMVQSSAKTSVSTVENSDENNEQLKEQISTKNSTIQGREGASKSVEEQNSQNTRDKENTIDSAKVMNTHIPSKENEVQSILDIADNISFLNVFENTLSKQPKEQGNSKSFLESISDPGNAAEDSNCLIPAQDKATTISSSQGMKSNGPCEENDLHSIADSAEISKNSECEEELDNPNENDTSIPFKCFDCDSPISKKDELKMHALSCHSDSSFKCDIHKSKVNFHECGKCVYELIFKTRARTVELVEDPFDVDMSWTFGFEAQVSNEKDTGGRLDKRQRTYKETRSSKRGYSDVDSDSDCEIDSTKIRITRSKTDKNKNFAADPETAGVDSKNDLDCSKNKTARKPRIIINKCDCNSSKLYNNFEFFKRHVGRHVGSKYKCTEHQKKHCGDCVKCCYELLLENLKSEVQSCKKCGYTTTVSKYFDKHVNRKISCEIWKISPVVTGEILCFACHYRTMHKDQLTYHMVDHLDLEFSCKEHVDMKNECLECVYAECLSNAKKEVVICEKCQFKTANKEEFEIHSCSDKKQGVSRDALKESSKLLNWYKCFDCDGFTLPPTRHTHKIHTRLCKNQKDEKNCSEKNNNSSLPVSKVENTVNILEINTDPLPKKSASERNSETCTINAENIKFSSVIVSNEHKLNIATPLSALEENKVSAEHSEPPLDNQNGDLVTNESHENESGGSTNDKIVAVLKITAANTENVEPQLDAEKDVQINKKDLANIETSVPALEGTQSNTENVAPQLDTEKDVQINEKDLANIETSEPALEGTQSNTENVAPQLDTEKDVQINEKDLANIETSEPALEGTQSNTENVAPQLDTEKDVQINEKDLANIETSEPALEGTQSNTENVAPQLDTEKDVQINEKDLANIETSEPALEGTQSNTENVAPQLDTEKDVQINEKDLANIETSEPALEGTQSNTENVAPQLDTEKDVQINEKDLANIETSEPALEGTQSNTENVAPQLDTEKDVQINEKDLANIETSEPALEGTHANTENVEPQLHTGKDVQINLKKSEKELSNIETSVPALERTQTNTEIIDHQLDNKVRLKISENKMEILNTETKVPPQLNTYIFETRLDNQKHDLVSNESRVSEIDVLTTETNVPSLETIAANTEALLDNARNSQISVEINGNKMDLSNIETSIHALERTQKSAQNIKPQFDHSQNDQVKIHNVRSSNMHEKKRKCFDCNFFSENSQSFRNHLCRHIGSKFQCWDHWNNSPDKCAKCYYVKILHSIDKEYGSCKTCGYKTMVKNDLNIHLARKQPCTSWSDRKITSNEFMCFKCQYITTRKEFLMYHMVDHLDQNYSCEAHCKSKDEKCLYCINEECLDTAKKEVVKCGKCSFKTAIKHVFDKHNCQQIMGVSSDVCSGEKSTEVRSVEGEDNNANAARINRLVNNGQTQSKNEVSNDENAAENNSSFSKTPKITTNNIPAYCLDCQFSSSDGGFAFNEHICRHIGSKFQCIQHPNKLKDCHKCLYEYALKSASEICKPCKCGYKTADESKLAHHIKKKLCWRFINRSMVNGEMQCLVCRYVTIHKKFLKYHMVDHLDQTLICDKQHDKEDGACQRCLNEECLESAKRDVIICDTCNFTTVIRHVFDIHDCDKILGKNTKENTEETNTSVSVENCDLSLKTSSKTSDNENVFNSSKKNDTDTKSQIKVRCFDCKYSSSENGITFKNHVCSHVGSKYQCIEHWKSKVDNCPKCAYEVLLQNLQTEVKVCSNCGYKAIDELTLARHKKRLNFCNSWTNRNLQPDEIRCLQCQYVTTHRKFLKYHLVDHLNLTYSCDEHKENKNEKCNKCIYEKCLKEAKDEVKTCGKCNFKTVIKHIFKLHDCQSLKTTRIQNIVSISEAQKANSEKDKSTKSKVTSETQKAPSEKDKSTKSKVTSETQKAPSENDKSTKSKVTSETQKAPSENDKSTKSKVTLEIQKAPSEKDKSSNSKITSDTQKANSEKDISTNSKSTSETQKTHSKEDKSTNSKSASETQKTHSKEDKSTNSKSTSETQKTHSKEDKSTNSKSTSETQKTHSKKDKSTNSKFQCFDCKFSCKIKKYGCIKHISRHIGSKFQCLKHNKGKSEDCLKCTYETMLKTATDTVKTCETCGYRTADSYSLFQHRNRKDACKMWPNRTPEQGEFNCLKCQYVTSHRKFLKYHMVDHLDETLVCDVHLTNENAECQTCTNVKCLEGAKNEVQICEKCMFKTAIKQVFDIHKCKGKKAGTKQSDSKEAFNTTKDDKNTKDNTKEIDKNNKGLINYKIAATCFDCKSFTSNNDMAFKKHICSHIGSKYQCIEHWKNKSTDCHKCHYEKLLQTLQKEVKTCQICNFKALNEVGLTKHLKEFGSCSNWANRNLRPDEVRCLQCQYTTVFKKFLKYHLVDHLDLTFSCDIHADKKNGTCEKCIFEVCLENARKEVKICETCKFTTVIKQIFDIHECQQDTMINPEENGQGVSSTQAADAGTNESPAIAVTASLESTGNDKSSRVRCFDCRYVCDDMYLRKHACRHFGSKFQCMEHENFKYAECLKCHYEAVLTSLDTDLITCSTCGYKTISKTKMSIHKGGNNACKKWIERKLKPGEIKCFECRYITTHKRFLKYHMVDHLDVEFACKNDHKSKDEDCLECIYEECLKSAKKEVMLCEICNFKTVIGKVFKIHKCTGNDVVIKEENVYAEVANTSTTYTIECEICNFKTRSKEEFNNHNCDQNKKDAASSNPTQSETDDTSTRQLFNCYHCEYKATDSNGLKNHAIRHYGQPFSCDDHNGKRGPNCRKCHYEHLLKKYDALLKICVKCQYKTLDDYQFDNHVKLNDCSSAAVQAHASNNVKHILKCFDCGATYHTEHGLKGHAIQHFDSKFTCDEHCDSINYECLKCIYQDIVKNIETNTYICSNCGYRAYTWSNLKNHEKSQVNCQLHKAKLLAEGRSLAVSQIKTYQCFDCDFSHERKDFLIKHITVHVNSAFQCDTHREHCEDCPKCSYRQLLNKIPRKSVCFDCNPNGQYTTRYSLKRHIYLVHKDSFYVCKNHNYKWENCAACIYELLVKQTFHRVYQLVCHDCVENPVFDKKDKLKEHVKEFHLRSGFVCNAHLLEREPDTCNQCLYEELLVKCENEVTSSENVAGTSQDLQNNYECFDCNYKTSFDTALSYHIRRKHLESDFSCTEHTLGDIDETSCAMCRYECALLQCKQDFVVKCSKCNFEALKKDDLDKHYNQKHGKETFMNSAIVSEDFRKKGTNMLQCFDCKSYITNSQDNLFKHLCSQSHARYRISEFTCEKHRMYDNTCDRCIFAKLRKNARERNKKRKPEPKF